MTSPAGYSGTPLARKLGVKADHRVATLGAPGGFAELLGELPDGATVEADPAVPPSFDDADARSRDVVILFAPDAGTLEGSLPGARRLLAWDGGLWIAWPKKSSSIPSDLDKGSVRRAGLDEGLVDNKVCAVDADWSGLRFVYRLEDRP